MLCKEIVPFLSFCLLPSLVVPAVVSTIEPASAYNDYTNPSIQAVNYSPGITIKILFERVEPAIHRLIDSAWQSDSEIAAQSGRKRCTSAVRLVIKYKNSPVSARSSIDVPFMVAEFMRLTIRSANAWRSTNSYIDYSFSKA